MDGYEHLNSDVQEILDELGTPYESAGAEIRIMHGAASLSGGSEKELSFCYYDAERAVTNWWFRSTHLVVVESELTGWRNSFIRILWTTS